MAGFKSGFIVLAGVPNAGKSTLLNRLAGGNLAIVTPKPQTTRDNIIAVREGEGWQAVFVDTPGYLEPKYGLQRTMLGRLKLALTEDADAVALIAEPEMPGPEAEAVAREVAGLSVPVFLVINKMDKKPQPALVEQVIARYEQILPALKGKFKLSAANGNGVHLLEKAAVESLPEHPPYFDPGTWTDRWERYFVSEIVRQQILALYQQEIPYSCAVEVEDFKEEKGRKDAIRVIIHVERDSQKPIIIGKQGSAIAKLRETSQKAMEAFLGRPVLLALFVKVTENWRNDPEQLARFGY